MRHSLAHIMATAVMKLWPEARLGIGPVVENGFYYDIDIPGVTISDADFKKIEKEMYKVINRDEPFVQSNMQVDDALAWAKEAGQPYKEELLNDLKRAGTTVAKDLSQEEMGTLADGDGELDQVGFYTNGEFIDLCRGPHVESTGKVGAFKLMRVAGAYWRGNEKNAQMQRLYGVAFTTKEDLKEYLDMLEEAKKRDHRKLGQELDLYTMSSVIGSGLPLFTPRGTVLRKGLERLSEEARAKYGWQEVCIPHITSLSAYEQSGHAAKFGDELMLVDSQVSSNTYAVKPMNCPHHIQLFASKPRSYRDMPQLYRETTAVYRDEQSGELHGLERVRSITQDDGHAFCTDDQIAQVVGDLVKATKFVNETLKTPLKYVRLSFRDEEGVYSGDQAVWDKAQAMIERLAKENELDYEIGLGEAAHYGPKIDFIAVDALGRETQVSTIQLDFVQPEKFDLEYTDNNGEKQRPVMVHAAILGSTERRLSVFIESTAGRFPFWVAPEQIRILTINDAVLDYVDEVKQVLDGVVLMQPIKYNELRYEVDSRSESLGKKIREATKMKVPMMLIIGDRDKEKRTVSIRTQEGEETIRLDGLIERIQEA